MHASRAGIESTSVTFFTISLPSEDSSFMWFIWFGQSPRYWTQRALKNFLHCLVCCQTSLSLTHISLVSIFLPMIGVVENRFYNRNLPFGYIKWPWSDSNSFSPFILWFFQIFSYVWCCCTTTWDAYNICNICIPSIKWINLIFIHNLTDHIFNIWFILFYMLSTSINHFPYITKKLRSKFRCHIILSTAGPFKLKAFVPAGVYVSQFTVSSRVW